ncbi:MAG: hypothetical protein SEPTF4163_001309 [Sporothrix epigloea]
MAGDHLALNHFAQATRAHPELAQLLTISNSRQRAKVNGYQAQLAAHNAHIVAKLTESDDRRRAETAELAAMQDNWHVADQDQRVQQYQTLLHLGSTVAGPQFRFVGTGSASAIAAAMLTMPSISEGVSFAEHAKGARQEWMVAMSSPRSLHQTRSGETAGEPADR